MKLISDIIHHGGKETTQKFIIISGSFTTLFLLSFCLFFSSIGDELVYYLFAIFLIVSFCLFIFCILIKMLIGFFSGIPFMYNVTADYKNPNLWERYILFGLLHMIGGFITLKFSIILYLFQRSQLIGIISILVILPIGLLVFYDQIMVKKKFKGNNNGPTVSGDHTFKTSGWILIKPGGM